MSTKFYLLILLLMSVQLKSIAQCNNNFTKAEGSLTPPGVGQSTNKKYKSGEYVLAYCQAGATYTVATCNGIVISYDVFGDPVYGADFDTQLTIYDENGTLLGFSDDGIGCGLKSSITFTSTKCQYVRILLSEYPCGSTGKMRQ